MRPAERWAGKYDYVAGERLRLEAHTRIAAADSEADVAAVRDEPAGTVRRPGRCWRPLLSRRAHQGPRSQDGSTQPGLHLGRRERGCCARPEFWGCRRQATARKPPDSFPIAGSPQLSCASHDKRQQGRFAKPEFWVVGAEHPLASGQHLLDKRDRFGDLAGVPAGVG